MQLAANALHVGEGVIWVGQLSLILPSSSRPLESSTGILSCSSIPQVFNNW